MKELEDCYAAQLDEGGFAGQYERECSIIPGRKFKFDFIFRKLKLAVEIQGGVWSGGAHGRPNGIVRDYEKLNLAVLHGWSVLQFDTKSIHNCNNPKSAIETTKKVIQQRSELCTKN